MGDSEFETNYSHNVYFRDGARRFRQLRLQQRAAGSGPSATSSREDGDHQSAPVPRQDEYVAIVKSRRSASIQPQVEGALTKILVKSGDHVHTGQQLMTIDPLKQEAVVDQQRSTELQKKAVMDYAAIDLDRQRNLYESGVVSKQTLDLAQQAYDNSKADYESSTAARVSEQRELAYYGTDRPLRRRGR